MTMRKRFLGWVVLAGGLLVGSTVVGLGVTAVMKPERDPDTFAWRAAPVSTGVRYDLVNRGLTRFGEPERPTGWEADEVARPLTALAGVRDAGQLESWLPQFDTTRMAEEEVHLGFYTLAGTPPTAVDIRAATAAIAADLRTLFADRPHTFPAGRPEAVSVRWSRDRQEAQVIARHTATTDGRTTVRFARWWLARTGQEWRAYDFDFPDTHLRFLEVRNNLLDRSGDGLPGADGPGNDQPFQSHLQAVHWLSLAAAANDPAVARAAAAAAGMGEPVVVRSVAAARHATRYRLAALQGETREALTFAGMAQDEDPDAPGLHLAAATARNARKDFPAARRSLAAYRELVGDNPQAYREEAKAANDPTAAVAVLRKGLTVFPGDGALLLDLVRRVPNEEREAVGELAGKTGTADILTTAADLYEPQFPALVDALATGFLRAKPNDRAALRLAVRSKMATDQPKAAGELIARLRDADREGWPASRGDVLQGERVFRQPVGYYELFRQVGEAEFAYRTLARGYDWLVRDGPKNSPERQAALDALDGLSAAHAAHFPNDPELQLWQAAAQYVRGEYAKADATLAAAMAKLPKPETDARTRFDAKSTPAEREARAWGWGGHRRLRTLALLKLGKWKQAYAELAPADDTFDQLADRFDEAKDAAALAELVELHGKKRPADPALLFWRGEVQFLRRNYEGALRHFVEAAGGRAERDEPPDYRNDERLVRTYLRLDRPDEAGAFIGRMEPPDAHGPQPLLRALVAVADEDASAVLDILDEHPAVAAALYADPDAAALRTKPAFAAVRQKYPPPVR